MNVELRHLRYFVAVAEEASFTAAAQRVHVAQQVLSAQVRQLEDTLGLKLLDRTSRGVVVTPAGEAFLKGAHETLTNLDRTITAARNSAAAIAGTMSVGLHVAASGDGPSGLLARFEEVCPNIEVRLRTFDLNQPAAGLLDHTTDVAFVRPPVAVEGVELRTLATEPRVFVLPADHSLVGRESLDLSEVAGHPWIAAELAIDGCDPTAWRDDWLVKPRPGGDEPIIGAVACSLDEWREHVVAGRGISLCPASAERYYARPGLAFVAAREVPSAALCVAWRSGETDAVVMQFVQVVTEPVDAIEIA
jgi:DNA-binding transcriptional LysR family regulator